MEGYEGNIEKLIDINIYTYLHIIILLFLGLLEAGSQEGGGLHRPGGRECDSLVNEVECDLLRSRHLLLSKPGVTLYIRSQIKIRTKTKVSKITIFV